MLATLSRRLTLLLCLCCFVGLGLGGGCEEKTGENAGGSNTKTDQGKGGGGGAGGDTILVGHYGSMTGKEATFGVSTDNGVRLALEEINAAGGLDGKKIEVTTYDTKGESKEAGNAVTRLITRDNVVAVIGEVASTLSLAGGQVCQEKKVPMISPSSTNPKVTEGRDYVFRVCFIDPFQGYVMAKFVKEDLKLDKVGVLYDQSQAYSKGLREEFTKAFTKMGGEIVADQAYSSGDQDFSAQLSTIKNANPGAVYVPGYYTEVANIAIQARRLGLDVPLLGGDGWDSSQLFKIGGEAIEGCYYSNHYAADQPTDEVREFVEKYKKKYGETPDGLAALGYDAMYVLYDAMKRSGSLDHEALRDAIAATKDYHAVTGVITMDENRNARKAAVVVQVKNGEPVFVTQIDPE